MVTIRFFFPRIWPVLFIFTVAIPAQVTVLPTWNIAQVTKLNQLLQLLSHSKLYFTNRHHHFINAYLVMINACLIFSNSSYYTQYKSKGFFFCPLWSHLLPIFPTTLNLLSFCQLLFHYKGITKQAKTCYLRAFEFALSLPETLTLHPHCPMFASPSLLRIQFVTETYYDNLSHWLTYIL